MNRRAKPLYINAIIMILMTCTLLLTPSSASAQLCWTTECAKGTEAHKERIKYHMDQIIKENNTSVEGLSFVDQLKEFQDWFISLKSTDDIANSFWLKHPRAALRFMSNQFASLATTQTLITGQFLDAQQQLETQRTFQLLQTEAHRDYKTSDQLCEFGTAIRSMSASEQKGKINALSLSTYSMQRQLGRVGTTAASSNDADKLARWDQFKETYCDIKDNNWNGNEQSGLVRACGNGNIDDPTRINNDINFTRLIDRPATLHLNFDDTDSANIPPDREDVIAMANNLYGHDVISRNLSNERLDPKNITDHMKESFFNLRSVVARRAVAQNSYNALIKLKSSGGKDKDNAASNAEFLGAILVEIGMPPDEVVQHIGENPSYYAQLELLAKRIYQNPDFFSNLYESSANVQRKGVAIKAIELLLDREIYESQLRRELTTSVLLSTKLRNEFANLSDERSGQLTSQ